MENDWLRIGSVIRPHGVKGEVKVYPTTDDLTRFSTVGYVYLQRGKAKEASRHEIESVKYQNGIVIVKLSGVSDMNEAESLRGTDLYITREQSAPLEAGQFFLADLLDLVVVDESGREIGVVEDILETGANDVFSIRKSDGTELLLPNIPDCILNVDLTSRVMTVCVLPGL